MLGQMKIVIAEDHLMFREVLRKVCVRDLHHSVVGEAADGTAAVELVADKATRRLVGGSVIGEEGAAGRIDVIATALQARMRVDEFEQLDLAYAPPFAPVWDPLLIAAQQLIKEL